MGYKSLIILMMEKPNDVQLFGIGCAVQSYIFVNFQMQHFLSLQANFNWQKMRIEKWVHLKYVSMHPLTTKAILNLYQISVSIALQVNLSSTQYMMFSIWKFSNNMSLIYPIDVCSGWSWIFQRGAPTQDGGASLLLSISFAENCMKMKTNGLREGGARDPPMVWPAERFEMTFSCLIL